jgi:hypothetical protein
LPIISSFSEQASYDVYGKSTLIWLKLQLQMCLSFNFMIYLARDEVLLWPDKLGPVFVANNPKQ